MLILIFFVFKTTPLSLPSHLALPASLDKQTLSTIFSCLYHSAICCLLVPTAAIFFSGKHIFYLPPVSRLFYIYVLFTNIVESRYILFLACHARARVCVCGCVCARAWVGADMRACSSVCSISSKRLKLKIDVAVESSSLAADLGLSDTRHLRRQTTLSRMLAALRSLA